MQRDVSRGTVLGAVVATAVTIALAIVMVAIIVTATLDAKAATPAEVIILGTPSTQRAECAQYKQFAMSVIQFRDAGAPVEQAHAAVLAKFSDVSAACILIKRVDFIWKLQGSADAIGRKVYEACMQGRT